MDPKFVSSKAFVNYRYVSATGFVNHRFVSATGSFSNAILTQKPCLVGGSRNVEGCCGFSNCQMFYFEFQFVHLENLNLDTSNLETSICKLTKSHFHFEIQHLLTANLFVIISVFKVSLFIISNYQF